ncbi:hypothetical protein FA13DRAFT_1796202 [Coprinellus micaceus]|uniref:Uncharacterized protein n=1 Tax=Coprinellus micaceus TaxID=71717 RepID=A0A4Y7SVM2_COPMI|nr:hypothetical protein FA13DRAFT_1796202 [Coprinellus micaceus]
MELKGQQRKARPRKAKAANHNPFSVLPTEDDDMSLTSTGRESTLRPASMEPQQPPTQHSEGEDEPSDLKPLTSTPCALNAPLVQTTMSAFVQPRPRPPDQRRPTAAMPSLHTPATSIKLRGQPPASQPSQRLQHIEQALTQAPKEREINPDDGRPRGKKRRMGEDEGDMTEPTGTPEPLAAPLAWNPREPSPLRFHDDESDEDMYTDESGDDQAPLPKVEREVTAQINRTFSFTQESPTKLPPTKRTALPGAIVPPVRERVNPFARFQPRTAPPPSLYVDPPPEGFKLPNTSIVEIFKYCTPASLDRAKTIVGRKSVVWILNDGCVTTPLDFARRIALIAMSVKGAIEDPTADPIVTPMEVDVNKPDGSGKYQHKIIQPYTVSGLTNAAFDRPGSRVYWSRQEITIGVFPDPIPISAYVLTLTNTTFLTADKAAEDKMTAQVQTVLCGNADFVSFVEIYNDRKPAYMGNKEFVEYTVRTAHARSLMIEQGGAPLVIFPIEIASPTDDAVEWDRVCQGLRHLDWTGVHCALVKACIFDYHCGNCKALDHPTPQCPLHAFGLYPNIIDEPVDPMMGAPNPGQPGDEGRINPFSTMAQQTGRSGTQKPPKHADHSRPTGPRNGTHNGTPRPPPGPIAQHPHYPYHPYPPQAHQHHRHNERYDTYAVPQGRSHSGRQEPNPWPAYPAYHPPHAPYATAPPTHPTYHPSNYDYPL